MLNKYKIIYSDDWCVAVKKETDKPLKVLYEHHDIECAYRAILDDLKTNVSLIEASPEDDAKLLDQGNWDYKDLEKYFER